MRKGLAVTLCAAGLAVVSNLALAAPLPMSLPTSLPAHPAAASGTLSTPSQSGIRPAVLEIAIPNSVRRALAHPADAQDQPSSAAKTVQWLTGPVPLRCQHGSSSAPAAHTCLVI